MSTAVAIGTWRRPSRRALRRNLAAFGAAALAHVLVLLALASGAHWMPHLVEPPVIDVQLLDETAPPPVVTRPPTAVAPSAPRARAPSPAPPVTIATPSAPRPAGPPAIVAPPGFTARKLVDESDPTREALRGSIGCRNERTAALTKAEEHACAEAVGERSRTAPMYAAIDPDKKAAFDGDCAKDDDWCLYRVGKGPYPGIFALGKKKKRKGWDD